MSSESTPCKHATDYEIERDTHKTWNDDGICSPCRQLLDLFETKRANAEAQEKQEAGNLVSIREASKARHPSNSNSPIVN